MWIKQRHQLFRRAGIATWCTVWAVGAVVLVTAPARAADDPALTALKQLFQKDPATAFDESWQMFQTPMKKGDLNGMMAIIRIGIVAPESEADWYVTVFDDMVDAALPTARNSGAWELLGELYAERAWVMAGERNLPGVAPTLRCQKFFNLSQKAFEKAGRIPNEFVAFEKRAPSPTWEQWGQQDLDHMKNMLDPKSYDMMVRIYAAVADGDDKAALSLMTDGLHSVAGERGGPCYAEIVRRIAQLLWLRGAGRLLPSLRQVTSAANDRDSAETMLTGLMAGCWYAWTGHDDVFRDTFYWSYTRLRAIGCVVSRDSSPLHFGGKLYAFGRVDEHDRLLDNWVTWVHSVGNNNGWGTEWAAWNIYQTTSPDLRRRLVGISLDSILDGVHIEDRLPMLKAIVGRATNGQRKAWAYETGCQVLNAALTFPTSAERPKGVLGAADLFDQAGRKDLAAQARALAASLSRGDPAAQLACALSSAQAAAGGGNWQEVEKQLQPLVAAGQGPAMPLIDATLLLEKAERHLGKTAEADACLAKAKSLVKESGLSAGERMNYLMTFANGTADQAEKTQLLEQAKQAAVDAGLPVMQASINRQLAELSLQSGDLAAAKQALLDIVSQQEAKRERLAFDPLLRQQWFADNLSVYRKLLTVAAKTDDATLALETGEKLRARALLDQLAWRKVDLAVHLPKALRDRLNALAEERKQTYALL